MSNRKALKGSLELKMLEDNVLGKRLGVESVADELVEGVTLGLSREQELRGFLARAGR
jgi:hypothetical protein